MAVPISKKTKKTSKADLTKEKTASQTASQAVSVSYGGQETLTRDSTVVGTYAELRAIRSDPTVALARGLLVACIRAGSWGLEADEDVPDERKEFMRHILTIRDDFLYNTVSFGLVDFGWQGFEKIYAIRDNRIVIEYLKPLLPDFTSILVTETGRFNGYRQRPGAGNDIDLAVDKSLHTAYGVEAGGLYGRPLLADVHEAYDMWHESNDGARRYDKKIAGSMLVVTYPPGNASVDGVTTDNAEIAQSVLTALESSGSVAIPTSVADVLQEITNADVADAYRWKVEHISDASPRQESFSKRLTYLDTLKVRGCRMPERSILEGQYGTKAEAGTHGNFAIIFMEAIDRQIVSTVNNQLVNPLLVMNYGDKYKGKVRIVAAPLVDKQLGFIHDMLLKTENSELDNAGLLTIAGLPVKETKEVQNE